MPYYTQKLREGPPGIEASRIGRMEAMFGNSELSEVTAASCPAERGSAYTLMYPEFWVAVPEPGSIKLPLAYPIPAHDAAFAAS